MSDCCEDKACVIEALRERQSATLKIVLGINAVMFVLGQVIYKIVVPAVPVFETMGAVGLLALIVNSICLTLLWKHRSEDINMSSVWECSRNDIASNIAVMAAAAGVWLTQAGWPDLVVGFALAALFLRSAVRVLSGAVAGLRQAAAEAARPVRLERR